MFSRAIRSPAAMALPRAALGSGSRSFIASPVARGVQEITREAIDTPLSLWNFTEEENMLRESGRSVSDLLVGLHADQAVKRSQTR